MDYLSNIYLPSQFSDTVSKIYLKLSISEESFALAELIRYWSPLTVNKIIKRTPFENRIYNIKNEMAYVETGMDMGAEKQRAQFKRAEIGYMPANGSICIFLRDINIKSINPIGKIVSNIDMFEKIVPGDILRVQRNKET